MDLVVGGGQLNRNLEVVEDLVAGYLTDDGLRYLDHVPITPADRLVPEDLAVTILINSRVGAAAFKAVQDRAGEIDLAALPAVPLQETTEDGRRSVAELVATVASWSGFAASVATKVLHKKRPDLIPILDNEAIFGAYMNPRWPEQRASQESEYRVARIDEALRWIATDLTRPENAQPWSLLHAQHPTRTRIELFDMIWWMHFRSVQPVNRPI